MDEFQIPEDISAIENLAEAEQAALDAEQALLDHGDDITVEQLDRVDEIHAHVEAIRALGQKREGEAQKRRDRAAAAAERLAGPTASETEPEPEADPAPEADPEPESDPAPEDTAPEAVAAAAARRRGAPSLIRRGQQAPANPTPEPAGSGVSIVASAGIPQTEAGAQLADMGAVTKAFQSRMKAFPGQLGDARVPDMYLRHSVATFSRGEMDGLTTNNPEYRNDFQALLDAAADEKRLSNGKGQRGLAAAGGWCAPSETFYDLVEMESADGLLDVPEVGVSRGGMRFTTGPDFGAIYSGVGFAQTEAQAIAGTTKSCYEVTCPDFGEVRLDAVGLCIKAGILTNTGYPELVRRTINGALIAHQHKVSVRLINSMATQLGTAVTMPAAGSVARATLTGLELAAEGQRALYRMPLSMTMEVVLPHWVRVLLRDDLQARLRSVEPVTDAQLDAHFAARKLRVQFVYGLSDSRIIAVPGGGTLLSDFPDTFQALMYPAGTFVKGTTDVISLDTVYDSTDLQVNVYTALFMEEGVLLAKRAPGGGRVNIPVVSKGSVGAPDLPGYGITDA